ncbi:hypothetical protein LCGC14_2503080 [marine sediment metagenome]|uniref:Uncharacterized protein n=1 Tax=marine sediment metagenome TaxID=412755 RepID=A0A0F9B252_9ZZZZ
MDEKLEKPEETCGLMLTLEGGVGVKINLRATKEEVISAIQESLSTGRQDLIQFTTSNPEEEEVCLFDPKRVLLALVKKEFIMSSGRIVPVQMAAPGVDPNQFKH